MKSNGQSLRILLVEDSEDDAELLLVELRRGGYAAVAAMKAGADDYLMKDRLARLVPAIKRALQESEIRRAHQRANVALRDSEERFRQLAENIGAAFFMFEGPDGKRPGALSYVSPGFKRVWGFPTEALQERPELWINAIHADDHERIVDHLWQLMQG